MEQLVRIKGKSKIGKGEKFANSVSNPKKELCLSLPGNRPILHTFFFLFLTWFELRHTMKKIHKNSCASRFRSALLLPIPTSRSLVKFAFFLRGIILVISQLPCARSTTRGTTSGGGSEVVLEFNNHRFCRSAGRLGAGVRHGCNLGG